jgi:hypothetical protein
MLVRSRLFLREQSYGISDLVDPRHAAALQFGATLGLLGSDASVLRGWLDGWIAGSPLHTTPRWPQRYQISAADPYRVGIGSVTGQLISYVR